MMEMINPEVWFALVYGSFLLLVAHVLDLLARHTATRTTAAKAGGFTYHEEHDAWKCSEDQWLWPIVFDPEHRVTRYQASPVVCNPCPVKDTCTTSDSGRQLARNIDPWPSSEAERFHRGIACSVVVLALLWPIAVMFEGRTALELVMLGVGSAAIGSGSWPLWSHLRRTPARFPENIRVEGLDETVAASQAAAQRSGYGRVIRTGPRLDRTNSGRTGSGEADFGRTAAIEIKEGYVMRETFEKRWAELNDGVGADDPVAEWSRRSEK